MPLDPVKLQQLRQICPAAASSVEAGGTADKAIAAAYESGCWPVAVSIINGMGLTAGTPAARSTLLSGIKGLSVAAAQALGFRVDVAPAAAVEARTRICEGCPKLTAKTPDGRMTVFSRCAGRLGGCTCLMHLKVRQASESCVDGHWGAVRPDSGS